MSSMLGMMLSGRYRLEERIGAGGMSTVYRAIDETLQRPVAIKLMHREVATDSDQLERFRREARAVAQLSHRHVVGVIDAGEDEGRPYIVLEYVEGETLKQRIRRDGPLPVTEAVTYAIEIAEALGTAHAHNIVHRDVKPQNVLIDAEGSVKVTDFGIARTLDEDGLTADGRVIGTSDYVAPEQAMGQPVTGQSDLYSVGIVLYEMLTGRVPFKGENQVSVAMKHVHEPLPDIRGLRPEISELLADVIETATAKIPEERYADECELIADLESARVEGAIPPPVAGEMPEAGMPARRQPRASGQRPARRAWQVAAALLAVATVAAAIAVVVVLASKTTPPPKTLLSTEAASQAGPPLHQIKLCSTCAVAYNPFGFGGDVTQNNAQAPAALDASANTAWHTETYFSGALGKPGVGLYVKTGSPVAAKRLTLVTSTPGFQATVYGSSKTPDPSSFKGSGWKALSTVNSVGATQNFTLKTTSARSAYFLIWITHLPPHGQLVAINDIRLYG